MSKATEKPAVASELPYLTGVDTAVSSGAPSPTSGRMDAQHASEAFSLSIPRIGAYRTEDHKYYWNGRGPYPSVTTILDVMDKPALVSWAKRTVAEIAVNRWEEVGGYIQKVSADAAINWLKGLPDYQRDAAGKLGSSIHLWADIASRGAEPDSETFQPSDEERPYLEAYRGFLTWLEQHGRIVSGEKMVWSQDGYGGTYDLIVRFTCDCHQGLWLVDLKTAKTGPYPEWALQLIAYGTADFIIIEDDPTPYPMPEIQRYGVLHLRPDLYEDTGWRLIEYPLIPSDRMAFLGALEIWRWKQEKRYTKSKLLST
jgi:hypothetical protein